MSGNPKDLLEAVRPASKGEVVQGVVDWVTLYSSSNGVDFIIGQLDVLYVLVNDNGEGLFMEGKQLRWLARIISLPGLYWMV